VVLFVAVPVVYLLSVAPLWVYVCQVRQLDLPIAGTYWTNVHAPPDWFLNYTKPYYLVATHTPAKDLLETYKDWVFDLSQ
jgi:hypothetical protein